jgi:4-alpha-glucanotransferase
MSTDPWGVTDGYEDALHVWQTTGEESRAAVHAAMQVDPDDAPPDAGGLVVVRRGRSPRLATPAEVLLEDGGRRTVDRAWPRDLPLGYHTVNARGRENVHLIVTPGRCHLPARLWTWGWAAQLYAARSEASWGIGDLADLARLGAWARASGAGLVLINPLTASMPSAQQQPSPYFPSSRRYRNPLYLRIEDVPGARDVAEVEPLAAEGRALNRERVIDRDRIHALKTAALDVLWSRFSGDAAFDRWVTESGPALEEFAVFQTLAEHHAGAGWRQWPSEYQQPSSPTVRQFAEAHQDRVRFHQWVQWLLDDQLARASAACPLMQDLPIGFDSEGADAWAWQDLVATDATVGAPPDRYIPLGQDWGLPPFIPHRLRAARYAPFVQTIRASLRHAGGLRIDHVMGLFRLFWVPRGLTPAQGAFVRYPADELLGIVALESHRARALVVGEDLGTVERGVRERLRDHAILSYRVMWFEEEPPAEYPSHAMAAATTHDLPTIAGMWTGRDVEAQRQAGLQPNEAALAGIRERLGSLTGLARDADIGDVIARVHERLAEAPSLLVTATLDDALTVLERPNMPSTTNERWPNWSLGLPGGLDALERSDLARLIARALTGGRKARRRATTRAAGRPTSS